MEANGRNCHRGKAIKRKAVLEKKRLIEGMIKAAYLVKDHLSCFPHLRHYQKNGLYLHLESGRGNKLSHCVKQYIQDLLKLNMEAPYGSEWPAEEKMKRREMIADEARYIFVHEISNKDANGGSELMDKKSTCSCNGPIVGFVHYRFVLEEEVPVVYIYELQLEPRVRGKGLGKFLMLLIELIACENKMGAVVLTVQRENLLAMDFYINKLRYSISLISPSRVDPLFGVDKSYEILCKTFDNEAQAVLKTAVTTSSSSSTASSKVSPPFVKRTKMTGCRQDTRKAAVSGSRRLMGSQPKFQFLLDDSTLPPFPIPPVTNKKNRADCEGQDFPKHVGGSITPLTHNDRLKAKQGSEPTIIESFMHTHSRFNTVGERVWVDDRSRMIHDKCIEKYDSLSSDGGSNSSPPPISTQIERWTEIAGGSKKGRVCGLAGMSSQRSFGSIGNDQTEREKQLEYEIQGLRAEMQQMRAEMDQARAEIAAEMNQAQAKIAAELDQLRAQTAFLTSHMRALQQHLSCGTLAYPLPIAQVPYPTVARNMPYPPLTLPLTGAQSESTAEFVTTPFYTPRPTHNDRSTTNETKSNNE